MGTLLLRGSPKQTICFSSFINSPIIQFWSFLFVLSKVVELGEWQGFVSLVSSQLHPSLSPPLYPSHGEFLPHPWVLKTSLTQAPLQILCHKDPSPCPENSPCAPTSSSEGGPNTG